jgi:8-oxo-dGTP diphosphatase
MLNTMPDNNANLARVGLGVIIVGKNDRVLVMKRRAVHAPMYAIPGGHLELGETFEEGAIREVKEELNIDIRNPKVIAVTNNLKTFQDEGRHYISIILVARNYSGHLKNMEPDKCDEFLWADPHNLPEPHFDASRLGIQCYLNGTFYEGV